MSEFADLGMRIHSEDADLAAQRLDKMVGAAGRAEAATDSLGGGSRKAGGAIAEMLASIEKTVRSMEALMRAQAAAAGVANDHASSQERATSAITAAYAINARYTASFSPLTAQIGAAKAATDQLTNATDRLGDEAKATAVDFATLYDRHHLDFVTQYAAGMGRVGTVQAGVTRQSKHLQLATLDLGRQFADIGVTAAMGMNPLMILLQQGPQIADRMALMKAEGFGLSTALRSMAASAAPILAALAPLAIVAGAAAGGFLLLNRELQKGFPKDITAGLNLTEEQLERVKTKTVTMGDVWKSTLDVMGKYLTQGPVGEGLKWLQGAWAATMDFLAKAAFEGTARIVGLFWGAYRTIEQNWRSLPALLGDVFTMAVNRAVDEVGRLVNFVIADLNLIKNAAAMIVPAMKLIPDIPPADLSRFKRDVSGAAHFFANSFAANVEQATEDVRGGMRKIGQEISAGALKLAQDRALSEAGKAKAAATREAADAEKKAAEQTAEYIRRLEEERAKIGLSEIAIRRLAAAREIESALRQDDVRSAQRIKELVLEIEKYEDLAKSLKEAAEAQKELSAASVVFERDAATLAKAIEGIGSKVERTTEQAIEHFLRMRDAWDQVFYSIRNKDWASAFAGLLRALKDVQAAFSKTGTMADKVSAIAAIGDAAGNAIGGRTGRAISSASSAGQTAFMLTGNPVIAGLTAAVAGLAELLKSKPSNQGAGYSLVTGEFSGKSRTPDTERAVKSAADAIRQGQDLLKAAGIELGATVHGLVIGTRDLSQIYLTNGRTVTSAVGDAAAAAEAGLRAVLEAATYTSEAQEKVARSALAAGKSFDEVIAVLAEFEAAQGILGGIQDEILRLTDPEAYDIAGVQRDTEAQRKAAQAAADAGYLTAEQLAEVNAQLGVLEALRLDEVLKRYADAVTDAAEAARREAELIASTRAWAGGRVESAQSALVEAYNREASAIQATIDRMEDMRDAMRDFRRSLSSGPLADNNAFAQYRATSSELMAAQASLQANPGDAEAYGRFQSASQAFLEAAKVVAPNSERYNRDLEAVRRATEEAEKLAGAQVSAGEAQLAALTSMVGQLVQLNAGVLTVAQAIANLQNALAVQRQLGVANDNVPPVDLNRLLAGNPDLARNWMAGGSLRGNADNFEDAVLAWWRTTGHTEVSQGLRTYAEGGMHPGGLRLVGERGPELEVTGPARYFDANETARMLSGGGDSGDLAEAVQALAQGVVALGSEVRSIKRDTSDLRTEALRIRATGVWARGETDQDPVSTQAA